MDRRGINIVSGFRGPQGEEFVVRRGWSDAIARELPVVSRQPHILASTPRDARERFPDEAAANEWYNNPDKEPLVYTFQLGSAGLRLGGLVWFSRQPHPNAPWYSYTSGFRMYEGAQGRGLARPFSVLAHSDMANITADSGVWLETDASNQPAVALYDGLGYHQVANNDGRLVMVWRRHN